MSYFNETYSPVSLSKMTEKEMQQSINEILSDYVFGEEEQEYDIKDCMHDYIMEKSYDIPLRSEIEKDLFGDDTSWCINDINSLDIRLSKDFENFIDHLTDCPQLFAFDGDEKIYLPAIRDSEKILTFDEIDDLITEKFKASVDVYASALAWEGDRENPPEYDDKEFSDMDITEYFIDEISFDKFREYSGLYMTGNEANVKVTDLDKEIMEKCELGENER